ncbi:MAG: transcription termination/antitermination protein NusG [Verrucomicrobiales bacterium]
MPFIPPPKDQWYVVHVLSGQEQKVRDNITRRIEAEEMGDLVFKVLVPTERVSEVKAGKKTESKKKFFPGYIIVNMHLLDEDNKLVDKTWYFIRETPGVINFAGTRDLKYSMARTNPIPMPRKEVESLLAQIKEGEDSAAPKIMFEVGETVRVADGPFEGQNGEIEEIDLERGTIRVSVDIFGRKNPVDLEYWQVEKE